MIKRVKNVFWKLVELFPIRHRLTLRVLLMRSGMSKFEEEWYQLHRLGPNKGLALDIGANRGYYTLKLATLYDKVIAFEPNKLLTAELVALAHPKIRLEQTALSSSSGAAKFFIPISATGELLDGWGSCNPQNLIGRNEVWEDEVPTARLDDLGLQGVAFIKMDVEGHELEVLKGAANLLREQHPTLLMEIRNEHLSEALELLHKAGLVQKAMPQSMAKAGSDEMYLFTAGEN